MDADRNLVYVRGLSHPGPTPFPPTQTSFLLHPWPQVDADRNLVYVRGQVPGPTGSFLLLRDAFRWRWAARAAARLPFPTAAPGAGGVAVAKRDGPDPYERYRSDVGEYAEGATWKTE